MAVALGRKLSLSRARARVARAGRALAPSSPASMLIGTRSNDILSLKRKTNRWPIIVNDRLSVISLSDER
eukprot:2062393-Pleurochrysis_carterae.AAC.1